MYFKHAVITALVTCGLIATIAVCLAFYRHDVSFKGVLEYVWGTSFAFSLVGFLLRAGASTGDTIERTEGVEQTSQNRESYRQADSSDAIRGFAFGTIVMISALIVFAGSLAILYFNYPAGDTFS